MKHKNIRFKTRRIKAMETTEQNNEEISKELDRTNPEDLPEYIRPFTHLFNKKKFEKLPERCEWNHEINLTEGVSYASSTYPENYIPAVMPPPNHTSPPSTAATFLATRFMVVLQPSGYSVFHGGDTPIQLSLP